VGRASPAKRWLSSSKAAGDTTLEVPRQQNHVSANLVEALQQAAAHTRLRGWEPEWHDGIKNYRILSRPEVENCNIFNTCISTNVRSYREL